jgi:hypothetical protein
VGDRSHWLSASESVADIIDPGHGVSRGEVPCAMREPVADTLAWKHASTMCPRSREILPSGTGTDQQTYLVFVNPLLGRKHELFMCP